MQPLQKAVNCIGACAMKPVYSIGGAFYRRAAKQLAVAPAEFTKQMELHQAAGTDFAAATTNQFLLLQTQLVPYRVARCRDEWRALTNCEDFPLAFKNWSLKGAIVELRFLTRLLFVFMFSYICARQSVYPLLKPGSPFLEQKKYMNPNY